jgi:hypothetical protein
MNKRDLKADLEWLREPSMQDGECIDDPDILGEYIRECNEIVTIAEHALERAIKAEALARELVSVLEVISRKARGRCLCSSNGYCESCFPSKYAVNPLRKAKEVLGDDRQGDYRTP